MPEVQDGKVLKAIDNKKKRVKAGSYLVVIFLLIYIPSFLHWLSGGNVTSDIIRMGLIEDSVNAEGLIIRDEMLLETPLIQGKYVPEVSEGERVPAFYQVATILNKTSEGLLTNLEEINSKIIAAENDKAKKADFFSEDMAKLDNVIQDKVKNIILECNDNSLNSVNRLKKDIDDLIEKKAEIAGEDSNDSIIGKLKQQKNEIQARINLNTRKVITDHPGVISYVIDGLEQDLTPDKIETLTPEYAESIKLSDINENIKKNGSNLGKPFVKLIRGNDYYIAAVIKSYIAAAYKKGDEIGIRINDIGLELKATIVNINEKNGKSLVTVSVNRGIVELSSMRKINIDFIKNSMEGLKVPLRSLKYNDPAGETAKIMLIKANCVSERDVDILCKNDEYAIIKSPENELKKTVNLYDTYVLLPEKVKEGDIVDK